MVRAVGRALSILEAFDTSRPSLALRDICEHTGIAKATAFRLIKTLEHAGYLVRLENQRLCLAPKLVRLAGMVPSTMDIRDVVRPVMLDLSRATGETVSLNTCSGWERVCVDSVNTPSPLMTVITPGEHAPLVFGALGKILLAFMDDKDVDDAIVRLKGGPPVNRLALKRQLRKFRSQGFSFTSSERIPGGSAIAVPLFDLRPQPQYCLALTGPSIRIDSNEDAFVNLMLRAGTELSMKLGGTGNLPVPLTRADQRETRTQKDRRKTFIDVK